MFCLPVASAGADNYYDRNPRGVIIGLLMGAEGSREHCLCGPHPAESRREPPRRKTVISQQPNLLPRLAFLLLFAAGFYIEKPMFACVSFFHSLSLSFSLSISPSQASGQGSLLGEPPKEVKLPSNPYLNLASVMPGMVLQGTHTHTRTHKFPPAHTHTHTLIYTYRHTHTFLGYPPG